MADHDYVADVKKYDSNPNEAAVSSIVKHLGIALRSRDASLVSCSSKDELARVRDSYCKKKLGMDDAAADSAIKSICEKMKGDSRKSRVVFYYLLAQETNNMDKIA